MPASIDLNELVVRESERVEWKENVADISEVVKTIVALANDVSNLGGGYVVCGAREGRDEAGFQKLALTGLSASRLKEVEGKALSECREKVHPPLIPLIEELPIAGSEQRILVFIVSATGHAHNYRSSGKDASTYYIRLGRETREARNSLLLELLRRKQAIPAWDRRVNREAEVEDIDLVSLREYLQEMKLWNPGRSLDSYLSHNESLSTFVPPLCEKEGLTNIVRPRNFALLLFGKTPTRFFPGAWSILSTYPGKDRSVPLAQRTEITGTVVEQAKKILSLLEAEARTTLFDKTSLNPNQEKYPFRAIQEAVINALVHRDYESDQPMRVTVFSDRIEIYTIGGLLHTVSPERFRVGTAPPYWRNQTLAYFFNKLKLAQAEGQGIATIINTMAKAGNPAPVFDIEKEYLICTLPAHSRADQVRQEITSANGEPLLPAAQEQKRSRFHLLQRVWHVLKKALPF